MQCHTVHTHTDVEEQQCELYCSIKREKSITSLKKLNASVDLSSRCALEWRHCADYDGSVSFHSVESFAVQMDAKQVKIGWNETE